MSSTDDHAQKVLLEQLAELQPQLARELLLNCYKVEREHQFARDADVVIGQLRRLIERALDEESGPESAKQKSRTP